MMRFLERRIANSFAGGPGNRFAPRKAEGVKIAVRVECRPVINKPLPFESFDINCAPYEL